MHNGQRNENATTRRSTGSELTVLFHGPAVFDEGHAKRMIELFPDARFYQAGTMGRTAAYDHHLDEVTAIPDLPGKVIRELDCDHLLIVIRPKTLHSGQSFVRMILDHAKLSIPVVHVDCANGIFVRWQGDMPEYVLSRLIEKGYTEGETIPSMPRLEHDGQTTTRHLQSCDIGDYVLCNNILIGTARDTSVSITTVDERIVATSGIAVKEHGLEKLDRVDLTRAKCCSTPSLRDSSVTPRISKLSGEGIAFIDHCGAEVYDLADKCAGAVTVGDDTSRIVGDILYRFSVPIYAITDGDWDGLLSHERFAAGSVVVEVDHDDKAGKKVHERVFRGNHRIPLSFEDVCERIDALLDRNILKCKVY